MIKNLVLEFIKSHDPMSKEMLLDKLTEAVNSNNYSDALTTLDSIDDITKLEFSMVINSIAKPGFETLEELINTRLIDEKDVDVIEELQEAKSKLKI